MIDRYRFFMLRINILLMRNNPRYDSRLFVSVDDQRQQRYRRE